MAINGRALLAIVSLAGGALLAGCGGAEDTKFQAALAAAGSDAVAAGNDLCVLQLNGGGAAAVTAADVVAPLINGPAAATVITAAAIGEPLVDAACNAAAAKAKAAKALVIPAPAAAVAPGITLPTLPTGG